MELWVEDVYWFVFWVGIFFLILLLWLGEVVDF